MLKFLIRSQKIGGRQTAIQIAKLNSRKSKKTSVTRFNLSDPRKSSVFTQEQPTLKSLTSSCSSTNFGQR